MMENWDLQAVVGGGGGSSHIMDQYAKESQQYFSFDPWSSSFQQDDEHLMSSFPGNLETNPRVLDELEQLYKPFYPDNSNPFSTQTIITTSLPVPRDHVDDQPAAEKQRKKQSFSTTAVTKDSPKPKRFSRKNQQNRVVQHVTADELPPDVWAWRKYGQKPIKGSPFPRSYYRCSSSKGCLARKQVERSSTDPRVFIITYSAEHCHGHPTRRSSLAGSTRNKSSSMTAAKTVVDCKNEPHAETETRVSTSTTTTAVKLKMEELEMVELDHGEEERGKLQSPEDIMLSDELLVERLENFDEDLFGDLSHEIWCTHE